MHVHFALLGLASLGVALGYRYRLSITAFFLLFTYVELIDQTTYLNHYYLVSLISFTMIFLPLGRATSLDSSDTPVAGTCPTVPRAALWMLRAQIGLVYVFAGVAKLNPDWLFHAEPLRIWLYNSTDTPLMGPLLREAWVPYVMSWAGACFDLTIVGWLLWRRTRLLGVRHTRNVPRVNLAAVPVHRHVPLDNDRGDTHLLRARLARPAL